MDGSSGAYYVSINVGALEYLAGSIISLIDHNPGLPVAVATDYGQALRARLPAGYSVTVIDVPGRIDDARFHNDPQYPHQGLYGKVKYFYRSPWEYTLFLDHDTYILADITDIFAAMRGGYFDLAAAHDVGRPCGGPYNDILPWCVPQFNTGVVGYHKSQRVESFMDEWWLNLAAMADPYGDQPAFAKAYYEMPEIRLLAMTCEYNLRFIYPCAPFGEVKILHGRHMPEANLAQIAKVVNKPHNVGRFWFGNKHHGYYDMTTGKLKDV